MNRWFIEDGDARTDARITREILEFIQSHGVKSVVMTDGIIGCPHEKESIIRIMASPKSVRSNRESVF
jgi:DNA invertase Pin-like site-specific DNA recombinase